MTARYLPFLYAQKTMSDNCTNIIDDIVRGDTVTLSVTFTDENGDPVDLTTATILFTARLPNTMDDVDDTTAKIQKSILGSSLPDPTLGILDINLDSTDTDTVGTYFWDIVVRDGTSTTSSMQGQLVIVQDVTKRTS